MGSMLDFKQIIDEFWKYKFKFVNVYFKFEYYIIYFKFSFCLNVGHFLLIWFNMLLVVMNLTWNLASNR